MKMDVKSEKLNDLKGRESNLTRTSLPLTNQKLWEMAELITDRQRKANELTTNNINWNMLEEEWFDWLEEELFGSNK